jgi:hypothetical protein
MESKKELIKGPLRPPEKKTKAISYTQAPASRDEVSVRKTQTKEIKGGTKTVLCLNTSCTAAYGLL